MIFLKRKRKSSKFAAEILCRNGVILLDLDFSGCPAGGIPAGLLPQNNNNHE